MTSKSVFYKPYTKQFDAQPPDNQVLGPGLYDISRESFTSGSTAFIAYSRQRPLVYRSRAAPEVLGASRTVMTPALYKSDKWKSIRPETPAPTYYPKKTGAACKICTTERFTSRPNYEKMAEHIVFYSKAHAPPTRGWTAKGQAFSGDRYKDDIYWMKLIDINM